MGSTAFDLTQLSGMKLCGLSWDDELDLRVMLVRVSLAPEAAIVGGAYEVTFLDVIAMSATGDVLYGIVERVSVSGDLDANPLAPSRVATCSPAERAALRLFELHTDEPEPALGVVARAYSIREVPARGY